MAPGSSGDEGATPASTMTTLRPVAARLSPRIRWRAAVGWPRPARHSLTATISEMTVHWTTNAARKAPSQPGRGWLASGKLGSASVQATVVPARTPVTISVRRAARSSEAVNRNSR